MAAESAGCSSRVVVLFEERYSLARSLSESEFLLLLRLLRLIEFALSTLIEIDLGREGVVASAFFALLVEQEEERGKEAEKKESNRLSIELDSLQDESGSLPF